MTSQASHTPPIVVGGLPTEPHPANRCGRSPDRATRRRPQGSTRVSELSPPVAGLPTHPPTAGFPARLPAQIRKLISQPDEIQNTRSLVATSSLLQLYRRRAIPAAWLL